jgi:hypothetical protein
MTRRTQAARQHTLVSEIYKAEEETYGHGIAAAGANAPDDAVEFRGRGPENYVSIGGDALAETQAPLARNQRRWGANEEIVELGTRLPSDFEDVLESRGRDQHHFSAASLQQSVGADGGATDELRAGLSSALALRPVDGRADRRGRIGGRRWYFQNLKFAAAKENAVGKGAAGVDGNAHHSPQIMPQERAPPARIQPERASSGIRSGRGRSGFAQDRFDLGNVIQVVTGVHDGDPLDTFLASFGVHAVMLPLAGFERSEQLEIRFAKSTE